MIHTVAPPNGDVNDDGEYTGVDFLEWQRGVATGLYDQDDLADWQSNYGSTPLLAGFASLPEPSTLLLAALGAAAAAIVRRP